MKDITFRIKWLEKVKTKDLVLFTRELSTLTNAGLSLIKSLVSLRDQLPAGLLREVLTEVIEGVERGESFSESLGRFPKVFPRMYVNMVKSGEASGTVDAILKRLALLLEKQEKLKKKVQAALVYPAFVMSIACIIVGGLMVFVVPTFTAMFDDLGGELPGPTKLLIAMSDTIAGFWWLIIILIVGAIFGAGYAHKNKKVKYAIDLCALRCPGVGMLVQRVAISRFARSVGTLLQSGVPILQTLTIVQEMTDNEVYAQCVPLIINAVKEGEGLSKVIEETGHFPNVMIKMVHVGEETGQLPQMLEKVAETYDEDIDGMVLALSSLMEPVLIIVLGLIVGFIVIAMFLPLFNITELL